MMSKWIALPAVLFASFIIGAVIASRDETKPPPLLPEALTNQIPVTLAPQYLPQYMPPISRPDPPVRTDFYNAEIGAHITLGPGSSELHRLAKIMPENDAYYVQLKADPPGAINFEIPRQYRIVPPQYHGCVKVVLQRPKVTPDGQILEVQSLYLAESGDDWILIGTNYSLVDTNIPLDLINPNRIKRSQPSSPGPSPTPGGSSD